VGSKVAGFQALKGGWFWALGDSQEGPKGSHADGDCHQELRGRANASRRHTSLKI